MIEHMAEHDGWHRERVDRDDEIRAANRRATISQFLTAAALVITVVFQVIRH
jgi:hypothetical protein